MVPKTVKYFEPLRALKNNDTSPHQDWEKKNLVVVDEKIRSLFDCDKVFASYERLLRHR